MRFLLRYRQRHPEHRVVMARGKIDNLPSAGQLSGELGDGDGLNQNAEQPLVEPPREIELLQAPGGVEPGARNEEQDRFATRGGLVQCPLPALAGLNAALRIEVEKNVVPAFRLEPVAKGNRFGIVGARMAEE